MERSDRSCCALIEVTPGPCCDSRWSREIMHCIPNAVVRSYAPGPMIENSSFCPLCPSRRGSVLRGAEVVSGPLRSPGTRHAPLRAGLGLARAAATAVRQRRRPLGGAPGSAAGRRRSGAGVRLRRRAAGGRAEPRAASWLSGCPLPGVSGPPIDRAESRKIPLGCGR